MRFEIILAPEALDNFRSIPSAHVRAEVRDGIERYLRHEPSKISKSRIKRLRGLRNPQYRLRIGEVRIFYDVVGNEVQVLAIVPKSLTPEWLQKWGTPR